MRFSPLALAERIIAAADRQHPADAVLRQKLKSERGLAASESAQISAAVFAYFRWLGWLEKGRPILDKIQHALELSAKFARQPQSFSEAELIARSIPAWVNEELNVSAAWARTLQTEPLLWLRARPGQGRAVGKELGHCFPFGTGPLADILRYAGKTDLFCTEAFQAGKFELQDISSQAVGLICAPAAGQTWWDACAGEGGKLLHLSDLMQNRGLIWASDRAAWRLQRLKRRAARARVFNFRVTPWDGGSRLPTKTRFDGILVDAPCSGIGTWQRNPHARWTTTLKDVQELGRLQQELLINVAAALKPGGRLIYAVCTFARTETRHVVEAFERACPNFDRAEFENPLSSGLVREGQVSYWPQQFGGNGMFIAAWRRQ
ncbi:MAG TPA: RsmB/NOP family class I SAM-dependent RNA methyltransferase [Candidatus Limnocylindrales bacterium]|nr:RsmB/NOP family class I SAM-dependent RNA methyltransferase [Candidatus Limnocylindrales bacterium]